MINFGSIERNKSKIINFAIIILALIIALQFFRSSDNQVKSLVKQQIDELEKNKVIEDISSLEKKAEVYKKVFIKKDLASIMEIISAIAKNSSVKIISVKPHSEEALGDYSSSSFLIMLIAPGYHALGDFISKIENHEGIFLVSEIKIDSAAANVDAAAANVDLNVSLKINTIAYL